MDKNENAFKALCEEYGLRKIDFSRKFGVPYRSVEEWFAGRREPTEYLIRTFRELLEYEGKYEALHNDYRELLSRHKILLKEVEKLRALASND